MAPDRIQTLVAPLVVGPKNSEAATGWPWRWVRDTARALGVPIIGHGRKLGVRADQFLAALERLDQADVTPGGTIELTDPAEAVRRALGKRRRST
jgi:hypothetical protein